MRAKKVTEVLRKKLLEKIEKDIEASSQFEVTEEQARNLLRKLRKYNPSANNITSLIEFLDYVMQEHALVKMSKDCDGLIPSFGGVQFSPAQLVTILQEFLKRPDEGLSVAGDMPLGIHSQIGSLAQSKNTNLRQAAKTLLKKYTELAGAGKFKSDGQLAAQKAAALLLRFVSREYPVVLGQIKRRNDFVHEALKHLYIKSPNPEQNNSRFAEFIQKAECFNLGTAKAKDTD